MATIVKKGYGQVEPNHLSAQRNGQIYAQLPLDADIEKLENGMFAHYDMAEGKVNLDGSGEAMLVYNEVKLYDERDTVADFYMEAGDVYPRLFKTNIGDIFTTNCLENASSTIVVGDGLEVNAAGYLEKPASATDGAMTWEVVKITTMPDGKDAIKVQRIA